MEQKDFVELIGQVWGFVVAAGGITSLLVLFLGALKNVTVKGKPLVKNGMADTWFKGLQVVVLVGMTAIKFYSPDFDLGLLNTFAADLANTYGALALILVPFSVRFGDYLYKFGVRKLPFFGKTFSTD